MTRLLAEATSHELSEWMALNNLRMRESKNQRPPETGTLGGT